MDGPSGVTQCPIAPNQTYTYNFTTGDIDGTFFWHGHYKQHYVDGFKGPMIIHDPNDNHVDFDASPSATYSSEAMLLLSDWYHEQSEVLLERYLDGAINPDGIEPIWDSGLINGIGQFECAKNPNVTCIQQEKQAYVQTIGVGETIRLRVCNAASFAAFLFSIDGHSLTVIEVDSVDVIPYTVDSLVINIAQRYSVLVTANQPIGNYLMRAVMYHGDPWTATNIMPVGMNPTVTAILNYNKVLPAKAPITIQPLQNPSILIDTNLVPSEPKQPPPIGANDLTVLFEFEFTTKGNDTYQKAYPSVSTLKDGKWDLHFTNSYTPLMGDFLLNQAWEQGSQWIPEAASNTLFVKTGQVVDIIVRNDDAGEHPMHLHGQSFWVMDMGVANSFASIPRTYTNKNPVRRDVVSVTACPYDDNGCLPRNATGFSGWTAPLNGTNVNALPEDTGGASNWFGYAVLRFVADNPGIWLFHCHIEWHIAAGLVMNFAVGVPEIQQLSRPGVANQTCSSLNQWKTIHDLVDRKQFEKYEQEFKELLIVFWAEKMESGDMKKTELQKVCKEWTQAYNDFTKNGELLKMDDTDKEKLVSLIQDGFKAFPSSGFGVENALTQAAKDISKVWDLQNKLKDKFAKLMNEVEKVNFHITTVLKLIVVDNDFQKLKDTARISEFACWVEKPTETTVFEYSNFIEPEVHCKGEHPIKLKAYNFDWDQLWDSQTRKESPTPPVPRNVQDVSDNTSVEEFDVMLSFSSSAIILCLSPEYLTSDGCKKVYNFASEIEKPLIPVYMFGEMTNQEIQALKTNVDTSVPFFLTSGKLLADFGTSKLGSHQFTNALQVVVNHIKEMVPRFKNTSVPPVSAAELSKLKQWLNPVDFTSDLEDYKKDFVLGTRKWLEDEVCDWARSVNDSSVLWACGAAGTGKSLFSYHITQHLPQEEFVTSIFFFCRHNNDMKNSPEVLVKTLIWMLCEEFDSFKEYVEKEREAEEKNKQSKSSIVSFPLSAFQKLVLGGLHHLKNPKKTVLITIDALDELNKQTRSVVLEILSELCASNNTGLPAFVKFFVTGRPEKDIYDCLTKINSFELEPTREENLADVELVVNDKFTKIWKKQDFNPMFKECLTLVVDKSEGLFIYVKLICQYLAENQIPLEEALEEIKNFSAGPDSVYSAIARVAIDAITKSVYQDVFGAILFVLEPLSLEHLSLFAGKTIEQTVHLFDKMRSILKLVDGKVSILHKSVKDFFTSNRCNGDLYIDSLNANALLAT
ncbi:hypothetical protein HDU99_000878, partial [Rhizoclosmatium hyalinum]